MKIYLVRHSESEDDLIDAYGGAADWKLTESGKKTVENFVKKCDIKFDKIYSSPLSRAYDTASIINKGNLPIEKMFELREFNQYGVMSGCTKEKAKEIFGYLLEDPKYKEMDYYNNKVFYGGETVSQLDKRVLKAFDKITKSNANNILVVTHTGVFRSFFKQLLKCDKKVKKIGDCGMAEISYTNGKFKLLNLSDIILQ